MLRINNSNIISKGNIRNSAVYYVMKFTDLFIVLYEYFLDIIKIDSHIQIKIMLSVNKKNERLYYKMQQKCLKY